MYDESTRATERARLAREGMYPDSIVVWAIRDDRDVADHLQRYLRAEAGVAASERVAA